MNQFMVGWGTLAMIIAGIAQGKNHSGLLWLVFGIIGGPITLFVLLLLDKE
jgi:hypothetical protein